MLDEWYLFYEILRLVTGFKLDHGTYVSISPSCTTIQQGTNRENVELVSIQSLLENINNSTFQFVPFQRKNVRGISSNTTWVKCSLYCTWPEKNSTLSWTKVNVSKKDLPEYLSANIKTTLLKFYFLVTVYCHPSKTNVSSLMTIFFSCSKSYTVRCMFDYASSGKNCFPFQYR